MFDEKGQIIIDKEECDMDSDDLMMLALDAGAEDFNEEEDSYEVLTSPEDFSDVRLKLEEEGIAMASAEVTLQKKRISRTSRRHWICLMKMMMCRMYIITGMNK